MSKPHARRSCGERLAGRPACTATRRQKRPSRLSQSQSQSQSVTCVVAHLRRHELAGQLGHLDRAWREARPGTPSQQCQREGARHASSPQSSAVHGGERTSARAPPVRGRVRGAPLRLVRCFVRTGSTWRFQLNGPVWTVDAISASAVGAVRAHCATAAPDFNPTAVHSRPPISEPMPPKAKASVGKGKGGSTATSTKSVSKSGDAHVVTVATGDKATVGRGAPRHTQDATRNSTLCHAGLPSHRSTGATHP